MFSFMYVSTGIISTWTHGQMTAAAAAALQTTLQTATGRALHSYSTGLLAVTPRGYNITSYEALATYYQDIVFFRRRAFPFGVFHN